MQLIEISPSEVQLGTRFRQDNELDEEFLDSIRNKGILQPITITPQRTLIAGGRRLAAALSLGLPTIPCVIREISGELDLRECELIENLYRKEMRWIDRTNLVNEIQRLMEQKHGEKWSQQKTADMLNRSVGSINRHLQLSKALKQFPKLSECKSEDEAVKLYRKLGEAMLVKHLVKQSEARASEESDAESEDTGGQDSGNAVGGGRPDRISLEAPLGVRLALNAQHHYRVGDAMVGMQGIIDQRLSTNFALVEVDPPYGIDLQDQKKGESAGLEIYNEIPRDSYPKFLHTLCFYLNKVTPAQTRVIFWFGTEWYDEVYNCLVEAGFQVDPIPGLWVKPAGQTASPDTYLARCYETFFIAWKGKPPIRKRGRSNVFAFNGVPAAKKYHPTQRPLDLMQEILTTFAFPGSICMVPFLGSGATLRAAYTVGMHAFGWDLTPGYRDSFIAQVEKDLEEGLYNEVVGDDL